MTREKFTLPKTIGIAIGDGANANKHNELCIRAGGHTGRTILSDHEMIVFQRVIRRIEFQKDN